MKIDESTTTRNEAASLDPSRLHSAAVVAHSADGCWIYSADGRRYFDATAGSGCLPFGHNAPRIVRTLLEQSSRVIHTGWNLDSLPRRELLDRLARIAPFEEPGTLFTVTGSEAIEAALKVARAATGRELIVSFDRSYHGKTAGSLSVTWRESFRRFADVDRRSVVVAPSPIPDSPASGDVDCLEHLDRLLDTLGPSQRPAAFILEPVQASEGVYPFSGEFLKHLIRRANECGALVIYDEIYTGLGRCGVTFCGSDRALTPHLLVIGKALGSGLPISAVLASKSLLDHLPPGHHTSTFAAHPLACAVGCTVLDLLEELEVLNEVQVTEQRIRTRLASLRERDPRIGEVRGRGLLLAFDILDSTGRPDISLAQRFLGVAIEEGIVFRGGGFLGSTIKITPPLIAHPDDVSALEDILERVVSRLD